MSRIEIKEHEVEAYREEAYIVISELYANPEDRKLMLDKLEMCTTMASISNLLAWGRVNLL